MSASTTARAWLTIAHGGGRWSVAEVRDRLPSDNPSTIETVMHGMADAGCLELYEPDEKHPHQRFGVTGGCRVPRGVTAWEVVEAMGLELRPELEEADPPKGITVAEVLRTMALQPRIRQQEGATS